MTILLETGPIERFAQVGNYSSYARCVPTQKLSNGKVKGRGNSKNGNRYLSMAFVEAAHYATIWDATIKRYYLRIPVNVATQTTGRLPPEPGQCCHPSERSDAGVLFYSLLAMAVN